MAKNSPDEFIDVDSVMLKPSSQRIRNILTLEERVAAIKAYECRPMYTKVAKMFNCSWEQIKNIIANRESILEFYEATKNAERQNDPHSLDLRYQKVEFLGECVYEYIQRLQYHTKADINEELIRSKAYEFRDIIRIETFVPNKTWINHFKATYNFSLSNRQIIITRTPPASLDLRDIVTFCTKHKLHLRSNKLSQHPSSAASSSSKSSTSLSLSLSSPSSSAPLATNLYRTSTKISVLHENDATAEELRQRRQRKLNFLERALVEYITRAKFHLKVTLDDEHLCDTATALRDMLKINNFQPNRHWLKAFKVRYDFDGLIMGNFAASTRTPPLSLDLKDILSYCSRLEKNIHIGAADSLKYQNNFDRTSSNQSCIAMQSDQIISFHDDYQQQHPPNTEQQRRGVQERSKRQLENTFDVSSYENHSYEHIKREQDSPLPVNSNLLTPIKVRKIEQLRGASHKNHEEPPPTLSKNSQHWSKTIDKRTSDAAELPKIVRSYADALKLLKPLEEFAMLEENFRAIGLLEQLESIFKNHNANNSSNDIE